MTIELVGGVEARAPTEDEHEPDAGRLAVRKGAGNVVELGSIAAFGFSPLWVLAAAADVTRGSRTYLDAFVGELTREGVLPEGSKPGSVDELLGALEGVSGTGARLIDIPPLEVEALRRSLEEIRRDAATLPSPDELARVFDGLREVARRERASLLEVSVGIGLAFFNSARHVGRQHVLDPYREDLRPLGEEGFGAYARRVSRPYADAVARHFDTELSTLTERGLDRDARHRRAAEAHVKRHPALAPLSDDHHHELVQARRLRAAADAGPEARLAAGAAYVELFFTETVEHFRREEDELFPVYLRREGADTALVERILREHMELHGLARALRAEVAGGDAAAETLRALGTLLSDHVRLEERELFEAIQRAVPSSELDALRLG